MDALYCLYQPPADASPEAFCGPVNVKTRQGLALVAFPNAELADYFVSVFRVRARVVALSALGTSEFPVRPKPPVRAPKLKLLFASKGVLSAWASDRQGFDTAPHVSAFRLQAR